MISFMTFPQTSVRQKTDTIHERGLKRNFMMGYQVTGYYAAASGQIPMRIRTLFALIGAAPAQPFSCLHPSTQLAEFGDHDAVTLAAPRLIVKPQRVIRVMRTGRPRRVHVTVVKVLLHVLDDLFHVPRRVGHETARPRRVVVHHGFIAGTERRFDIPEQQPAGAPHVAV
jgi:hypothetical protein